MRLSLRSSLNTLLFLILPFLAAPAAATVNRWAPLGPDGGTIQALAADPGSPGRIYAGTDGSGVWKSTDGGGHWLSASAGLGSADVYALAVAPGAVWAGTGGGRHPNPRRAPLAPRNPLRRNRVGRLSEPRPGSALVLRFRRLAGGRQLHRLRSRPAGHAPQHPRTVFVLDFNQRNGNPQSLFRSPDGGETWRLVLDQAPVALAPDPATPGLLYAAADFNHAIWKSADNGVT